eukprot:gene21424-28388_t
MKRVLLNQHVLEGEVLPTHFKVDEGPLPEVAPEDGVLVDLIYVSVDPYMRGRFRPGAGYFVSGFELNEPITSGGVGRVVDSKSSDFSKGDLVVGFLPWEERATLSGPFLKMLNKIPSGSAGTLPVSVFLGPLGMVGLTAYGSLKKIAQPKAGETAFVSGAAGAVGCIVGQLLKNVYGCRIIGSAGTDDKVAHMKRCGFDEGWNYRTMSTQDALAKYAPEGLDIYYDNVGGETLEAALDHMNNFGRIVACGSISQYDTAPEEHYGLKNLFLIVTKRLLMQGFICFDFDQEMKDSFMKDMSQYVSEKKVTVEEHLFEKGLENAGNAFCLLMKGANTGKALVQSVEANSKSNGAEPSTQELQHQGHLSRILTVHLF